MRRPNLRAFSGFAVGIALLYPGRVAAFWVLGRLFALWNVNAATYAYAPAWARAAVDGADGIAAGFALSVSCAAMGLMRSRKPIRARACLRFAALGALTALALTGILVLAGSARVPRARGALPPTACMEWALDALFALHFALLWRVSLAGPLLASGRRGARACAYALSALGQALATAAWFGEANIALLINALLTGLLFCCLFERKQSAGPEIAFAFAFRTISRRALGYPDWGALGVYPVSEAWLTGGQAGLEGAGITTILLALVCAYIALRAHRARGESSDVR